jgi:nucleoside-diphosphate-sugar epimerase
MRAMADELHVLFGGGQVGQPLARILLERGKRVRLVKRSARRLPAGVNLVQGDATDLNFCIEAARGASTVYHCMNPPYYARVWEGLLPRYMDNLLAAARFSGARLVVLDNVYMLGRPQGRPLNEDTPPRPCSRKGEVRARVAERMWEAHRRGDVRVTSGRASDFYGPGGTLTHLGDQFWRPVIAGKRGRVLVNPDAIHTYHYIPDVAAGLATLGTAANDAYGRPWMLPCAPAETMRALVVRFSQELGRKIELMVVPRAVIKTLALVVPFLREIDEMSYQWEEPFVIDDRRFRAQFGQGPEDVQRAAAEAVTWAKLQYASR